MPAQVIGGFYIETYEFTRSWGIEPASASGTGVIHESDAVPSISVGSAVVYSFLGVTFHGLVSRMEKQVSQQGGNRWSFSIVDNRIRLKWAIVFGQWNMEEDPKLVHSDSYEEVSDANFEPDENGDLPSADFSVGTPPREPVPVGPRAAGNRARGRLVSHIPPANWATQRRVYSTAPKSAATILREAFAGALGSSGFVINPSVAQQDPVFNIDANSGISLSALVAQLADAQGLQVTMDGSRSLRFERRGNGTLVVPPGAYVESDGTAISSEPTKVRIVGGRNLVQVNEVPLYADWSIGWEEFVSEPNWLDRVEFIMRKAGPLQEDAAMRAEVAALARSMTLRQYMLIMQPEEDLFLDDGKWGGMSRMDIPVWVYVNEIVYRSYRISKMPGDTLYGVPIGSLELHDQLLCAVTVNGSGDQARTVYSSNPVQYYPRSSAFVIAQGQPVDLLSSMENGAVQPVRTADMTKAWSEIPDFTLDVADKSIRFSSPVFLDGSVEDGKSLLYYPNLGQMGSTDISEKVDPSSSYLSIAMPNPNYEISWAPVRAALVFKMGIFYRDYGSGVRWTSANVPLICNHLLHGAEGFVDSRIKVYEGDIGYPEPPEEGFLEILYEDGSTAEDQAAAQAAGITVRGSTERSGRYIMVGAAGSVLNGAIDRISISVNPKDGMVETVEFAKPRATRGFISSRDIADRVITEELFDGQRDLAREVNQYRAIAKMERQATSNSKPRNATHNTLPDVLRKPFGVADNCARCLNDPSGGAARKAGSIVWLDESGVPSDSGNVFGGIVVAGTEAGQKYVNVVTAGTVPVLLSGKKETGIRGNGAVYGKFGDPIGRSSGDVVIGRLVHGEGTIAMDVDEVYGMVELAAPVPMEGRFTVIFDQGGQRVYVSPGSVAWIDLLAPPVHVEPFGATMNDEPLSKFPFWEVAEKFEAGTLYHVVCIFDSKQARIEALTDEELGDKQSESEDAGEVIWSLASIKFAGGEEEGAILKVEELDQVWESDIGYYSIKESSSSALSSEGVGDSGGGESDMGSSKDTAIVPAPWLPSRYAALFTVEAPEVRFEDCMRVRLTGRVTRVKIDFRYIAVCEPGSLWASVSGDRARPIGAWVDGDHVVVQAGWFLRPRWAVISLTGIRKGFRGIRFPARNHAQFQANEERLQNHYPSWSPPESGGVS